MSNSLGKFVWYDLSTTDSKAAISFYTEVVGWKTQSFEGMEEYTMWAVGDDAIGGVMPMSDPAKQAGAPPHWLAYINTPDVDESAGKAKELGAQLLVEPMDIPNVGRFSVVADPQGAVFALFTSASEDSEDWEPPKGKPGSVVWHELMTDDLDAAWSFYEELFGWEKTESWGEGEKFYQMFGQGDDTFGGMAVKPDEVEAPPYWMNYFEVDGMDAAVERLKANGGQVAYGPTEVPGGSRIVVGVDPQGAHFALHEAAESI